MNRNHVCHDLCFMCRNVVVFLFLWGVTTGCSEVYDSPEESLGGREERMAWVNLTLGLQGEIDSAQVLFFRPLASRDSLFRRTMIYKAEAGKLNSYRIQLPAGSYSVWVFGNVPTECLVANPPYTSNDVFFDYNQGVSPSAVFYGRNQLQVGADTAVGFGLLLLSSAVELQVSNIPTGVESVTVELMNTSSGLTLNNGYLEQTMNPPLRQSLQNVVANSSYLFDFYCFPVNGKNDSCWLEVNCMNALGKVVYSGESSRFSPRPGTNYKLSCLFDSGRRKRNVPQVTVVLSDR